MPRIFDNIDQSLLPALQKTLKNSQHADFCIGYFNLRGWRQIDELIEGWTGGPDGACRLMIGMQSLPQDELRNSRRLLNNGGEEDSFGLDQQTALRLKRRVYEMRQRARTERG